MLLVKTRIGPSSIHGTGLFADEFIAKGTLLWRFTPGFDLKFSLQTMERLPALIRDHICKYGWLSAKSGFYCYAVDDAKFFNHADTPNARSQYRIEEEEVVTVALRDIVCGEELTDDYSSYDKLPGNL